MIGSLFPNIHTYIYIYKFSITVINVCPSTETLLTKIGHIVHVCSPIFCQVVSEIRLARRIICVMLTDAACWTPIIILTTLALAG